MRANEFINAKAICCSRDCRHTVAVVLYVNSSGIIKSHEWTCGQCLGMMVVEISQEQVDAYKTRKKTTDDKEHNGDSGNLG